MNLVDPEGKRWNKNLKKYLNILVSSLARLGRQIQL